MKYAACLLVAFACSGALASEPGQPLDCSDVVFLQPGYACSDYIPFPCVGCENLSLHGAVIDNQGRLIKARVDYPGECASGGVSDYRYSFEYWNGTAWTVLARLDTRCYGDGADFVSLDGPMFDATGGRLLVKMFVGCAGPGCSYPQGVRVISIGGFTRIFDVSQTYEPTAPLTTQPAAFAFRVPVRPEGLEGADHFNTYWGQLTKPIDFAQANGLQCGYPAMQPQIGDRLTVADTVPTPAPGQGVYYVTAATYQGATRYGRKTSAGHLSGRDPAVLPACTP